MNEGETTAMSARTSRRVVSNSNHFNSGSMTDRINLKPKSGIRRKINTFHQKSKIES